MGHGNVESPLILFLARNMAIWREVLPMKPPAPNHLWVLYQLLLVLSPNLSDAPAMSVHTCTLVLSLQQPLPTDRSRPPRPPLPMEFASSEATLNPPDQ